MYIRKVFREQVRKEQKVKLLTCPTQCRTSGLLLVVDVPRSALQVQPS